MGFSGMRQRMAIASGLLAITPIFSMDEPTVGIDPQGAKEIREFIEKLNTDFGQTVFLTTHYMREAEMLCDRVAIMDRGRILACDSPHTLKEKLREIPIAKIEVSSTHTDFSFMETIPGVVGYSQTRNIQTGITTLKVMARDESVFSDIASMVNKENSKILSINKAEPTLEDVYISLVGKGFEEAEVSTNE